MLRELRLRDFRCFESLVFQPAAGLNFIIGPNAQGKTSILEAACILLRLQSPKASSLGEAVRFEQPGFGLDGHWREQHLQVKFAGGLKAFTLDSKPQTKSADYLAVGRVVWIGNDDLQLVRGSGSGRRRYLDFLGAQIEPGYLRHLRAYERALRSRNALLKDNRPRREIAAFDGPLIDAGTILLENRARIFETLSPLIAEAYTQISGATEIISTIYLPGSKGEFAAALEASRDEETRLRVTVVGPHRDDIDILLNNRRADTFASEGQQRSISLALKLGQAAALGTSSVEPPIYLIDDVFGELDRDRRNNLMKALPPQAQKLITSTTLNWREDTNAASVFQLDAGKLTIS
jgi:DNA replication and repair protein RecF